LVFAAAVGVLSLRARVGLPWLRAVEFLAVGMVAAVLSALRVAFLRRGLSEEFSTPPGSNFYLYWGTLFTDVGWMSAVVIYGVAIPNPWRRTAVVVLLLAALPFLIDAGVALRQPERARQLAYPLVMTGQILLVAVVVALYGTYRINVLQKEVSAARTLGPYQLQERLGAGGMGEVYLAAHRLLKRPCAVKLIRPDRAGDPNALGRFEREVQATARLRHPNTVAVFDYGQTEDGTFYYVMEYLPGLSLKDLVRRHGPQPPARVMHFLGQLCGALREAHALGLVHRDIKPSNVRVCRYGGLHDVVKLLDFGLVKMVEGERAEHDLSTAGLIVGTPEYMAPEQASGAGVDARSDLYSLGATAYFLLAGRPPFVARTALDVLFAHRHEAAQPPSVHGPDVPADLEAVILRCLAKEPADRFPDIVGLEKALAECQTVGRWTEGDAAEWWRGRLGSDGQRNNDLGE
jgi:serine/threonine-protein kinase